MIRLCLVPALACALLAGCNSRPKGTTDPSVKLRLERLLAMYQLYTRETKKPPADEATFRTFLAALPPEKLATYNVVIDDDLFASPRDGQKFVVKYGTPVNPSGEVRKVAWEAVGANGRRFVALSMGYVEEYSEASFQELK